MAEDLPDLKFDELRKLVRSHREIDRSIRTGLFKDEIAAYVSNMDRVFDLAELAPLAMGLVIAHNVERYAGLGGRPERTKPYPFNMVTQPVEWRTDPPPLPELPPWVPADEEQLWRIATERGFADLPALSRTHKVINGGLRVVLSSMLAGAWTAFEALATDVWERAVNCRPRSLVTKFLGAQGKQQEKSVRISAVLDLLHDLPGKMGSLLRTQEKVDFTCLDTIQKEYGKLFGDAGEKLFDDPRLRLLELERNLFAHQGGVVDQKFVWNVRDYLASHAEYTAAEIGKPLNVDAERIRLFVEAVTRRAGGILSFADEYARSNEN